MWLSSVSGCVCLLLNSRDVQAFLGIHVSSFGNFTAQWYTTTGTHTPSRDMRINRFHVSSDPVFHYERYSLVSPCRAALCVCPQGCR